MDDPRLGAAEHHRALLGLARLNSLGRGASILWPALAELARQSGSNRLRLLDVATGAGDVPLALHRKASRRGIALEVLGVDKSSQAVAYATQRAAGRPGVAFQVADCLSGNLPAGYDAVCSSLFLHHLGEEEVVALLRSMARAARRLVLVSDLERSRFNAWAVNAAAWTVTASPVVRVDAARSMRAAFSLAEIGRLAQAAGLAGAIIVRRQPCRFLLQWWKP